MTWQATTTNRKLNVEGTRSAVELANDLGAKHFHHTSSIAVSGRYRGLFLENMFDEGQKFGDPYSRTKFESEKLVREECKVPGAYTGRASSWVTRRRGDGQGRRPVLLLQGDPAATGSPAAMGSGRRARGRQHQHRARRLRRKVDGPPRAQGRARRAGVPLCWTRTPTAGHVINVFARAAHAPEFAMRIGRQIMDVVPKQARGMVSQLPPCGG